ncbi:hypothetical protein BURPS1710b_A0065 [Burkholderia pseudomallei 1710b]|uniref:Uncharacterized protein n=1 Tax=Burkholderia pseudomallei (strain 1710b) TaxID=320372 RepID=Q3JMH9_BURP1|nr:hypothetical protein BURPS1710b_A0065 [Burkholderia pseudomallei 1710b]
MLPSGITPVCLSTRDLNGPPKNMRFIGCFPFGWDD